jgi:chromosome partitioning protein
MLRRTQRSRAMAFVIAVAQRKGGAGKSTIAANLAAAYAEAGQRVALLDIDPQRSLARWDELRGRARKARPLHFEAPSGWRVPGILDRLKREADVVLLDTAPHDDTDARVAVRSADLVLVPLQPSAADLWSMDATLDLAKKEGRRVMLVLNRAPASGRLLDQVRAAIAERGLPLSPAIIGNRTAFAQAFMAGLGAVEAAPKGVAAEEMRALAAALRGA